MKTKTRIHAKSSSENVPAQTKKQPQSKVEKISFDLKRAKILIAANICDILDHGSYLESYYKFIGLAALTKHLSGCKSVRDLNAVLSKLNHNHLEITSFGEECASLREMREEESGGATATYEAEIWFHDFYQRLWPMTFWEVSLEFGKFLPWVSENKKYKGVIEAMRQVVECAEFLNRFAVENEDSDCEITREVYLNEPTKNLSRAVLSVLSSNHTRFGLMIDAIKSQLRSSYSNETSTEEVLSELKHLEQIGFAKENAGEWFYWLSNTKESAAH